MHRTLLRLYLYTHLDTAGVGKLLSALKEGKHQAGNGQMYVTRLNPCGNSQLC